MTLSYGLSAPQVEARRSFLGASEARIIMEGSPENIANLIAVKRGEKRPNDLSGNRAVLLGHATEDLNRYFYQQETGTTVERVGEPPVFLADAPYIGATLDGFDPDLNGPFEAKFHGGRKDFDQLIEQYFWQLQQQMLVTGSQQAVLSVIFGANADYGYRVIAADDLAQLDLQFRAQQVWECVETGKPWPDLPPPETPKPTFVATKTVDMTGNNEFAVAAGIYRENQPAARICETAKVTLRSLMPADAKVAVGYGLELKRNKSGAVTVRDAKERQNVEL